MQEPTLHGWRMADGKHMRMSGYAAKVRSMSWSANGKALATSGSTDLIVWPFQSSGIRGRDRIRFGRRERTGIGRGRFRSSSPTVEPGQMW